MRKIIKSANTEEVNTFRLHYFPNIPVPDAKGGAADAPAKVTAASAGGGRQWPDLEGFPPQSAEEADAGHAKESAEQGYAAGFAKGETEGREAAQAQAEPLFKALETVLGELDGVRRRVCRHLEQEVVELALHVARKVIRHELTVSQEAILRVVEEAMGQMDDPGRIAIRLHPQDLKRVRDAGQRMTSLLDKFDSVAFEEDAGLACGGCYIQTEFGDIDARVQEQLRTLEEALRAELHTSPTE